MDVGGLGGLLFRPEPLQCTTMSAPSEASDRANSLPMLADPPVTMATFPACDPLKVVLLC